MLAAPGHGEAILDWIEPRAATALAATAPRRGRARDLRQTAEYTSDAEAVRTSEIGSFQGVSLRAADAYIDVEAMRIDDVAGGLANRSTATPPRSTPPIAKWWACMGGHRVSHTCQHLHGGIGADIDYPIHRYFLRLKHVAMTLGGAGEQLATLGARIADEARAGVPAAEILQ